jgi:spore maturation protein CgeB
MIRAGWSPSVRLFEAAACGTPVISDRWDGLTSLFAPGEEILLADDADMVLDALLNLPENARRDLATAARTRVLAEHTASHRAAELDAYLRAAIARHHVGERVTS